MGVKSNVQGISIAPLKTALQYADSELGIDVATASYSEICEALAEAYPELADGVLYQDGKYGVEWENGVTVFDGDGVPLVGGFTLASDHIQTIIPSSFGQRVLNTVNTVDLTNYSRLHIEGSNGSLPAVMDVSGITGSMYITVFAYCNSAGTVRVCRVFATPSKSYVNVYGVVEICSTAQANNPPSITKIWLE